MARRRVNTICDHCFNNYSECEHYLVQTDCCRLKVRTKLLRTGERMKEAKGESK